MEPNARIRATVIGASQYTVQVSGNTIFIAPDDAVPVRNVARRRAGISSRSGRIHQRIGPRCTAQRPAPSRFVARPPTRRSSLSLGRLRDLRRLQAFCSGVVEGLKDILAKGHPLVLVNDGDIGGIIGLHFQEELKMDSAIISIDGIALSDFDYIDVGALIPSSGAVPVVIKSLIFPASPQE